MTSVGEEALPWLWGARIQRVDGPRPGVLALSIFAHGKRSTLLLAVGGDERGVGSVTERPKGAAASSYVQRLRRAIENARLASAQWLGQPTDSGRASALSLEFARGDQRVTLIADFDRKAPNLLLLGAAGQIVGASEAKSLGPRGLALGKPYVTRDAAQGILIPPDAAALEAAGAALATQGTEARLDTLKRTLCAQLRAALKRAERKAAAIEGDLARAGLAPGLRRQASLLLCNLAAIPRGADQVSLRDESVEPPEAVQVALDPTRDAKGNAQAMFERARKVERGTAIATQRLDETRAEVARLRDLQRAVAATQTASELEAVTCALGSRAASAQKPPGKRGKPQAHTPYHTFESADGARILVGKGAADNDTLTLNVARPHDHWLHARSVHGSHVIVRLERGAPLPPEVLLDAAHLAAHFSAARGEPVTEVQHTERRYVRKPKGAAPGAVNLDREKVLRLRMEPERLARLLKR